MNCKRCGKPLPSEGYICKFCGMMMDKEQIDYQRKIISNNQRPTLVSEKYGNKLFLFQKRDKGENKIVGFIVILAVLIMIIILALGVYFS